ncbi:hypothetical protein [Geodermatophilus marinus]
MGVATRSQAFAVGSSVPGRHHAAVPRGRAPLRTGRPAAAGRARPGPPPGRPRAGQGVTTAKSGAGAS